MNGEQLPVLVLPEKAYGVTGYIDGLQAEDMPGSMVKGTDRHGRPFLAIRYTVANGPPKVETIFQRYVENSNVVTSGGPRVLVSNARLCPADLKVLTLLATEGQASALLWDYDPQQNKDIPSSDPDRLLQLV